MLAGSPGLGPKSRLEVMRVDYVARRKFPLPVRREEVARSWRERGYSCDPFIGPPGRGGIVFVHGCNELVTVVEGRLRMTIAGVSTIVDPGDEVFIPKGALHSVQNVHDAVTRWLYGYD